MGGAVRMKDPYEVLQMPHSATAQEIKVAYRTMARMYHPDKFVMSQNESERQRASMKFTECAAAYALLADAQKKAEYDHIYKYGGFDDDVQNSSNDATTMKSQQYFGRRNEPQTMGIGYICSDPFTCFWTQGRIESRRTMAGVQLPSRHARPTTSPAQNVGMVTISTGRIMNDCTNNTSTTKFVCETKKYFPFEKRVHIATETVTLHPDGRQDFVIEEGDSSGIHNNNINAESKRRHEYTRFTTSSNHYQRRIRTSHEFPWYIYAWKNVHDKFSMCYNPCATVRDE